MKERTANNVRIAFIGESKAYQRLLFFAEIVEKEDLPQIAHLFRAVAAAEGVHAKRNFALLESFGDTQTNLEQAFQSEKTVGGIYYKKMIKNAEEDGEKVASTLFSQSRDVEALHEKLYKKALDHLIADRFTDYYVCTVCGFLNEKKIPEKCPICNASKTEFKKID
jgi:rubrerythrin